MKSGNGVIFFELKRIAKAKTTAIEHSERLKKLVSNDHIKKNQHFEEAIVEETNFDDSCVHDPGLFIRALVEDKNNWAYHFNIAGFSVITEKDPLMQAMWHYIAYGVTLPNHYYRGLKDTGKSVDVEEFIMEKN